MLSRAIVGYNVFVGYSKNQQKAFYLMIALESMKLLVIKCFYSKFLPVLNISLHKYFILIPTCYFITQQV